MGVLTTYTDILFFFFGIVTPLLFRLPHLHLIRILISFVIFLRLIYIACFFRLLLEAVVPMTVVTQVTLYLCHACTYLLYNEQQV